MLSENDAIEIVRYDPEWPEKAQEEIISLRRIFDPVRFPVMEHIGSTSIQGLDAKPIIDILIACQDIDAALSTIPQMKDIGYVFWDDNPDKSHLFFVKGMPPYGTGRTHHVHIHQVGHSQIKMHLTFRDHLRGSPELVESYRSLKYRLATEFRHDREGYTAAKTDFVHKAINLDI